MAKFYQDISASGGTIRTHELREPRAYYGINKGIKSGNVLRIKNGVYMLPEELATTMIDVERIVPGGVVCMYSAWDYYGLTTQIPDGFYVAIEKHRKVVVPEISGIVLCYWQCQLLQRPSCSIFLPNSREQCRIFLEQLPSCAFQ